jgi:EAL domain-containing protein (putative c-di-GMP-specific phosphodiesterase class I)
LQVYDAELSRDLRERMQLREELRHALARQQLRIEYQPEVDLRTGEIHCMEALLRWHHPALGTIEPARFIPLAEETGLIEAIGAWVIERACLQATEWRARMDMRRVSIAINLSARQLGKEGLEAQLARCLSETGLNPASLELELTENASMESPDHVFSLMHRFKGMGLSIAIDDFGTGLSNMRYLQRLPVDKLKLDGSFVEAIATDPGSLAIAEAIIAIAHRLGLKVVAEMVETEAQVRLLRERGCDLAQGFFFSRPVPPQECAALLATGSLPLPEMRP